MIVNRFRVWAQTASPSLRADGASALARACLYSNLDDAERADAVQALTRLLDDPSPLVRRALAEAFGSALDAPHHIVLSLAEDQPSVAAIVLARSPILTDAELIDCAATGNAVTQSAIAMRPGLSSPVAAALAEVGAPEALATLAGNPTVTLPTFSLRRMVERHGGHSTLREALLMRPDLPASVRLDLVAATTQALGAFVVGCNWMSNERMHRLARETRDKAAIIIADQTAGETAVAELVQHLRENGHLSVGFILRAVLSGKTEVFRAALSNLSGVPLRRVDGLTERCEGMGFAALYREAALPMELLPAFRIALQAVRQADWTGASGANLARAVVERVLTACEAVESPDLEKLVVLLRRFESEAARHEARQAPIPRTAREPLTLKPASRLDRESLVLVETETSAFGPRRYPALAPPPAPRTALTIDLEAIEAELCAA